MKEHDHEIRSEFEHKSLLIQCGCQQANSPQRPRGELYRKVHPDQIRLPLSHLTLKPVKIEAQKQVRDLRKGLVLKQ